MQNIFKKLKIKRRGIAILAGLHFYGNSSKKLKIIGVTGTNGKTTTATLLYRVAIALGYKCGLIGTVENMIAEERVEATHTTPDPISLHKLLNEMKKKDCEYVFMEVSSHALDQNRVAGIKFTGGVFTNLTHDHLDYHKNFDNYFGSKKKFFKMLPANAFALSNMDDEYGSRMLEGIRARKFSYGFGGLKDFYGKISKIDFSGLELNFDDNQIKSKLLGKFNAYNLLGVWGVCKLLYFDMEKVKDILENIDPPRGRFEHFTSDNGVLAIVDYAHTPDALEKVLQTIREIKKENSRIISVFGCGGDRDPMKRPVMGKIGVNLSDVAIFTSDNSRSEDPDKIIAEMKKNLSLEELEKVKSNSDRREAIREAVKIAQSGDIILCAGKGHEDYQIIKGVTHHFDDLEELRNGFSKS
ncbi:MAG: UDP-N-acetylmuramoyl-L-alanyl-D-glutamate--2,6-diaminopimelate ligase [Candidatus Parcubacteria bacterium]|nr:UDP-N-acetylmuramoyl-L-alanyl-D-glutamate--2,6-diaminopimelate ligase [Candidatus Parcubacteria bacterium]